jgi:hypothetical protein
MMTGGEDWFDGLPAAITVTGADGTILLMNERAIAQFAADGGAALIGKSVLDCHPEPARSKLVELYKEARANHYTISVKGQRKIIHQIPWYRAGAFAGLVELSVPIPEDLPHFVRGEGAAGSKA